MIQEFHIINSTKNASLAYHYPSATIIEINDFVAGIMLRIQEGETLEDIANELAIESVELSSFINKLFSSLPAQKTHGKVAATKRFIGRITLHVSNDCNLRCTYCYADGGKYAQDRQLMTEKTALDFVHFFADRFDIVEHVVFFGGEPMMNIPIIEKVCEEFNLMCSQGKLDRVPSFGIITNGTILNQKVVDLVNEHIQFITVSIDGPKDVNDSNRVFIDGSGSFDKIAKFIHTMQNETTVSLRYESTLSEKHIELGITEEDIAHFMEAEFKIKGTIVPDINSNKVNIQSKDDAKLRKNKNDIFYLSEAFLNILSGIVYNNYRCMCMVGSEIVAISVDGAIYPCHMNSGKEHLSFGSIYGDNIFDDRSSYLEAFPFLNNISKQNGDCKSCWAQKLCGGCAIRWFFNTAEDKFNDVPNVKLCERMKKHIERILMEIVTIKKDPIRWKELVDFINEKKRDIPDEC